MRRAVAALVIAVVSIAVPEAAAHGGLGPAQGYTSSITSVSPEIHGLEVAVVGGDHLRLTNRSGRVVTILGYQQEPYLRFADGQVFENQRSPATYLNASLFGDEEPPPTADPKKPPLWKRVSTTPAFSWHDHRIHWMNAQPPSNIEADPGTARTLFDWKVPGTVGTAALTIDGKLVYTPPPGQDDGGSGSVLLWAVIGLAVAIPAVAALYLLLARLTRPVA